MSKRGDYSTHPKGEICKHIKKKEESGKNEKKKAEERREAGSGRKGERENRFPSRSQHWGRMANRGGIVYTVRLDVISFFIFSSFGQRVPVYGVRFRVCPGSPAVTGGQSALHL